MPAPMAPVELVRTELPFPTQVYDIVLAGGATTVLVPSGAKWVEIAPVGGEVWIRTGGTAANPGADITDGNGSFPVAKDTVKRYRINSILQFSLFGTCSVGLAFYGGHGLEG